MIAAVLVAQLATQLAALADEDRVHVQFFRDAALATCPDDDSISDRVRDRIGSEPFRDDDGGRELRVGLVREGEGALTARIALFAPNGRRLGMRVLHGSPDCITLADDLVLAIAIAIDPLLLVRRRVPVKAPEEIAMPAPVAAADAPADGAPDARPAVVAAKVPSVDAGFGIPAPVAVTGRALLGVAGGVGVIATPSARMEASFKYGVIDFDPGVRFDLPTRYPVGGGALIDVALLAAEGAVCGVYDIDVAVTLRGCGTGELGGLAALGVGLQDTHPTTSPWLAVGARGGLDVRPWPELGLVLQAELDAPLLRPRFIDDVTRQVYAEPGVVVWDIVFGAELQIR